MSQQYPPGGGQPGQPGGWGGQPQQGGYPQQQGGYPPQQPGYPPQGGYGMGPGMMGPPVEQGNMVLGILAGFFGGCIGLALVYMIAKGEQTKKGALYGFLGGMVLGIIVNVAANM